MVHQYQGGCDCGNLSMLFESELSVDQLAPRACDCDFCTGIGADYLSDPRGRLTLQVKDKGALLQLRQGSGSAEFLQCKRCRVLVAVLFADAGHQYAAVNARALRGADRFPAPVSVSPKSLDPATRRRRWRELWISGVSLQGIE